MAKKKAKKVSKKVLRLPSLDKMGLGMLEKQLSNCEKKEKAGRSFDESYKEALEVEIAKRKELRKQKDK